MSMLNPFKGVRIEFHILQSFPVTCLNRDDVGAPKTAVVGSTTRARVSSQCWKRQIRLALRDLGVKLGIRSKSINKCLKELCLKLGATTEQADSCAEKIANALAKDTLLFFSENEAKAFADYIKISEFNLDKIKEKDLQKELAKISKKEMNPSFDALDIALFGRMVAVAQTMNVQAAASFAHAISTHKISNEIEFFTALDDLAGEDQAGASHMGSLEFNSATYYRYISLNLGVLSENLGSNELGEAVEAFTKALFIAIPSARQTTQAGASVWEFAKILVRRGQGLQVPFETAVKAKEGGFLQPSVEHLKEYLSKKKTLMGSLFSEIKAYEFGEDEKLTIDDLIGCLKHDLTEIAK